MATRAKDATVKKDKKPIASSQAQRPGNPRPGGSQLGSNDKVKSSSSARAVATSPARKPTPNYLRPTLSSKPETKTATRKSTATSANNEDKARLLRRRSFDRPPSLSRQDSSSANKEAAASRLRTSSSLKSTGNSSNRAASSVHKPGGSRSVNPALKSQVPLRRSSSSSSYKNGISSAPVSSTTSPTKADKAVQGSDPDNKLEETIEDGLVCSDAEAEQVHSDELEASDKEHLELEAVDTEVGNAKNGKIIETRDVPSESEDQNPPQEVLVEEAEGELLHGTAEGELENLNGDEKSPGEEEEERNNIQAEYSSPDEVRASDQDKEEENVVDGQDLAKIEQPAAEEAKQEEEGAPEAIGGDQVDPSKEEGGQEEVTDQVAKESPQQHQEAPAASPQKRVVVQGKKESPSAYNDVIEETKNKLLEARKNKVKALVGAFETVIDYESGSK